jgi:mono/diheme cytochrome c family protein
MRTRRHWLWLGIMGVIGVAVIALGTVYAVSGVRFARTYEVEIAAIAVVRDAEAVALGAHVATIRGCTACHGDDLGGSVMHDDPMVIRLVAPNLTAGTGGLAAGYRALDLDRAIRHGVRPNGKPLIFHPAHEFHGMSDEDTAALIAYLETIPPVDRVLPRTAVGPVIRSVYLFDFDDGLVLVPAEHIDHRAQRPTAPVREESVAYGAYLSTTCSGCHGPGFSGGPIPGAPPDVTPGTNITPAGQIGSWSREQFVATMRTGLLPDGRVIDPKVMPWPQLGTMTDHELGAVYLYLRSLPSRPTGTR